MSTRTQGACPAEVVIAREVFSVETLAWLETNDEDAGVPWVQCSWSSQQDSRRALFVPGAGEARVSFDFTPVEIA